MDFVLGSSFPPWAAFGLLAAFLSSSQLLLQEKFKGSPFAMAFWNKVGCAIVTFPLVLHTGLPTNPVFYALLATQALMWAISDVVLFKGVNEVGAGVVARLLPIGTLISFFLWFAIDRPLALTYAAAPLRTSAIVFVFILSAVFAWNLRKCTVTRKGIRAIWFTLCAVVVGTLFTKIITQQAPIGTGIYGYVFVEALIMNAIWLLYYVIRKPVPAHVMFGKQTIKAGITVGLVAGLTVASNLYAVYYVDNPAYVTAVRHLNAVLIIFFYRATGRPSEGRVWAGLGIVACAAALIVLRG